jgi:hypothetical protein
MYCNYSNYSRQGAIQSSAICFTLDKGQYSLQQFVLLSTRDNTVFSNLFRAVLLKIIYVYINIIGRICGALECSESVTYVIVLIISRTRESSISGIETALFQRQERDLFRNRR